MDSSALAAAVETALVALAPVVTLVLGVAYVVTVVETAVWLLTRSWRRL